MPRQDWIWMPHPAHLIVSFDCRFHLATYVGGCIVSTVGEYFPDEGVREIHANSREIQLEGRGDARRADFMNKVGFIEIGCDRTYETMVFAAREPTVKEGSSCCPWMIVVENGELDFQGYNDPGEAYQGHLTMCQEWDGKTAAARRE